MKIAVTAASGKLGSAIVRQLVSEIGSENVVAIARSPEKIKITEVNKRKGDYNSRDDFEKALEGIEAVLIVSGNDYPEKRIGQHRNIIEAAKSNGVKKLVYTSIVGAEEGNEFSPIVSSNRQTEKDIRQSGLNWAIGRNGIYIEPDLEYIGQYKEEGGIKNSAGDGRCGYTSRPELAVAYSSLLLNEELSGQIYNLFGSPITQSELAMAINRNYSTEMEYHSLSPEEYLEERRSALGEFLGTVIAGIYSGIRSGSYDIASDYEKVTGREHKDIDQMIQEYKSGQV